MEFWGVEVKPGVPLKVQPGFGKLIHMSQAALGEIKDVKGTKNVPLRVRIDSKDLILGTLAAGERPQVMFDLVFEKEFELSHDCKSGSVYFMGYIADDSPSDGDEFSDFDDESEDEALEAHENGVIKPKVEDLKDAKLPAPAANANVKAEAKKEVKAEAKKEVEAEVKNEEQSDSDSSSDDEDASDSGSDDDMPLNGELDGDSSDDMSDDSDDEDSSDEELPQVQQSKKRQAGAAQGTPIPPKKAKAATPDNKTGNKKGGHTATPFPSKPAGKFTKQSPKSGGQFSGNKSFNKSNNKGGRRGGK